MKDKKKFKTELLGVIHLPIVGCQYYDAILQKGETIHFEREKENEHDRNAVLVQDSSFKPAGHLRRAHAAYLAPLIDAGKIMLSGKITGHDPSADVPLAEVSVHLCPRGRGMLEQPAELESPADILFDAVRKLFLKSGGRNPEAAKKMVEKFTEMCTPGERPETWLLCKLLVRRIEDGRREMLQRTDMILKNFVKGLRVGEAVRGDGLCIFPVFSDAQPRVEYATLEDVRGRNDVKISEVNEEGEVPELLVTNKTKSRLLIIDGEELVGAKQNRIVNVTIMIPVETDIRIPVSCVEAGRWRPVSDDFDIGFHAVPSVRRRAKASVMRAQAAGEGFHTDQGAVWDEVQYCLHYLDVDSQTSAMHRAFEARKREIEEYMKALQLPKDAVGYVAVLGEDIIGADVFDSALTLQKKWPRLVRSYAVEALRRDRAAQQKKSPVKRGAHKRQEEIARRVLEQIAENEGKCCPSPGEGVNVNVETPDVIASALVCDEAVVHLGACAPPEPRMGAEL